MTPFPVLVIVVNDFLHCVQTAVLTSLTQECKEWRFSLRPSGELFAHRVPDLLCLVSGFMLG